MRIALLEDELSQAEIIRSWLREADHDCQLFGQGKLLIRELGRDTFDLIILDWMLPDIDGIEVLRWIRANIDWPIPVLFVTGKDSEGDIVEALENGADDYMTKPIKRLEMLARVKAISRRVLNQDETILEYGNYKINIPLRTVYVNDTAIDLTQKEYDLVQFLFRSVGRVLSRGHILESVWGRNPEINTRTVDTHISRIRNKLDLKAENGWQLKAVYQHGYRLEPCEDPEQA